MTTSSKKSKKQTMSLERKLWIFIVVSILVMIMAGLAGCKTRERVTTSTEYVDRLKVDTILNTRYDSVYIRERGDTVFVSKYRYVDKYKVVIRNDTVNKTDTVVFTTVAPPAKTVKVRVRGFFWWVGFGVNIAGAAFILYKIYTKLIL